MAVNAREHLEWLSLLDVSGPFLTIPVLTEYLPDGLDKIDSAAAAGLRTALASLEESRQRTGGVSDFVRFVLGDILGYDASVLLDPKSLGERMPRAPLPEAAVTLRPDYALYPPPEIDLDDLLEDNQTPPDSDAGPVLLINIYPDTPLNLPMRDQTCSLSPLRRMEELCRASGVPLGLVSNGREFTLVYAPGGKTATFVSWYADLWLEERITLQSFITLLHKKRFFGVDKSHTLPALMEKSANAQQDVTDKLGWQTRGAITEFIRALDGINRQRQGMGNENHSLLASLDAAYLYEAALTVMMRLVFLLAAEERGLLRLGNRFYDDAYAVSTLCQSLRAQADKYGEEVLEYRHDAWVRLLGLFRAVFGGVNHESLNLPAYGGSLFDPDKYPFLEGRDPGTHWRQTPAAPLPINNRVVLHMLESLQFLRDRQTTGLDEAVRLSFRSLDVEQIGHVYEGLLERTAARAEEPLLGLTGKNEPYIALAEVEALAAQGEDRLVDRLVKLTGSTQGALKKLLAAGQNTAQKNLLPNARHLESLLTLACMGDTALAKRILPFVHLLRKDLHGFPVLVLTGGLYVTAASQRRASGAHYTPRHITATLVAATLEPHVYEGPAQGLRREEWRPLGSGEILNLKICDMAMGSGAFLVQACRWLSEKLLDAWAREKKADLPEDLDERAALARRKIADHCLYGVDSNPLAVDLARLSLWLVTMRKDRPFTFLNHALACGDALLGITYLKQLEEFSLFPAEGEYLVFGSSDLRESTQEALQKRRDLAAIASDSILDVERKAALLAEAEKDIAKQRLRADALILTTVKKRGVLKERERYAMIDKLLSPLFKGDELAAWLEEQRQELIQGTGTAKSPKDEDNNPGYTRPFHWALEFPEVFARDDPGFDAVIGNPPFMGSQRMRESLGNFYREYLIEVLGNGIRGETDLAAYFFLRASQICRKGGDFGLIATNTIAQGHTRKAGLLLLEESGRTIRAAWPNVPWEGNAAVTTSQIVMRNGTAWQGEIKLSDKPVAAVSTFLKAGPEAWEPQKLKVNENIVFQGNAILGDGFIVNQNQAEDWLKEDGKNANILSPFFIVSDLTSDPEQKLSRWVINFYDWDESAAKRYVKPYEHIFDTVKPVRQRVDQNGNFVVRYPRAQPWWQFAEKASTLYHAIGRGDAFKNHPKGWQPFPPLKRILARGGTTDCPAFCFIANEYVMAATIYVFASNDAALFGTLQSNIHEAWACKLSSTFGEGSRYTPTFAFATFPLPQPKKLAAIRDHAESLHSLRKEIMSRKGIGLTKLYNHIHSPQSDLAGVDELRAAHEKLDRLCAAAYGWDDLDMGHDFREVEYLPKKDNTRHTVAENVRLEILTRLTALNRQRFLDEQKTMAEQKARKAASRNRRPSKKPDDRNTLLPENKEN